MDPSLRTHHLLKHCLSQSQRSTALAQFNTLDSKEAAKEIARMGQRELQAKFKASIAALHRGSDVAQRRTKAGLT
jgi:Trp operon repressor